MTPAPRRPSTRSRCELVANPALKRQANAAAARIAGAFPAGLAKPALRALHNAGLLTLKDLSRTSESQLATLHGIGPNALALLKGAMAAAGVSFKP
jgi:hypothetical protein